MSFFTHFDFESVLSSNKHSWQAGIYYTYIIARRSWSWVPVISLSYSVYPFFLSHTSSVFSPLHDKHFEANEKILVELMNRLPHFITQSIDWYDGFTRSVMINQFCLFSREPAFDLLVFCSLQLDSAEILLVKLLLE